MRVKRENAAIVGVGVAACAVCCAGPILGVFAAIGLGTAAGFAVFGGIAVLIGAAIAGLVMIRRRLRVASCAANDVVAPVPVEFGGTRTRP